MGKEKFVVAALQADRGFGFADSFFQSGAFFFHARDCQPGFFQTAFVGQTIEGEIVPSARGLRIINVKAAG